MSPKLRSNALHVRHLSHQLFSSLPAHDLVSPHPAPCLSPNDSMKQASLPICVLIVPTWEHKPSRKSSTWSHKNMARNILCIVFTQKKARTHKRLTRRS